MGGSTKFILLDIEGTTTPVDFVYKTLFPYARENLPLFVEQHWGEPRFQDPIDLLWKEHQAGLPQDNTPGVALWSIRDDSIGAINFLISLMDQDRKSTALKEIQGLIWQEGYKSKKIIAEVFPDVPAKLKDWHQEGLSTYIYSSGSVLAQKLLFSNTLQGDLTPFISGHFDTNIGPKKVSESYRKIAAEIGGSPAEILFISDIVEELQAASAAGLKVILSLRPGNATIAEKKRAEFQQIISFLEI